MTERQKMFLDIAENLDRSGDAPGGICYMMMFRCDLNAGFLEKQCHQWNNLLRGYRMVDSDKYLWPLNKQHISARVNLCCLVATMSDEEYEELTK